MKIGPLHPIGLTASLLLAISVPAAQLDVLYDLMHLADSATISHAEFTEFQRHTRADGIMRPAIFMHPSLNEPASVSWPFSVPAPAPGERVLFVMYAGLSDGLDTYRVDGVGLSCEVNGRRLVRQRLRTSAWVPCAVDLASWAGQRITLSLISDDGGEHNVAADWALFGEPRILRIRGNAYADDCAPVLAGGIVLDLESAEPAATLELTPVDASHAAAGPPITMPIAATSGVWYTDFDLSATSNATAVRVTLTAARAHAITVAPFAPAVELVALGPDRSVLFAGEPYALCATLKNTGNGLITPAHALHLVCAAVPDLTQQVARINPGEQITRAWPMPANDRKCRLQSTVHVAWQPSPSATQHILQTNCVYSVWPAPPVLPPAPVTAPEARALGAGWHMLQTPHLRVLSCAHGAGPLILYAATNTCVPRPSSPAFSLRADAVTPPPTPVFVRVATAPSVAELVMHEHPEPLPRGAVTAGSNAALRFVLPVARNAGRLLVTMAPERLPGTLRIALRLDARRPLALRALRGPALLAGDGTTGARKRAALFPGLEFLDADEPSSSARAFAPALALRLVPDPYDVSIPLMAVETPDALVALLWNQRQQWSTGHYALSSLFASPNFLDVRANHRMQLFVPSDTHFVPKNATAAAQPFELGAGQSLSFSQTVLLKHQAGVLDAIDAWIRLVPGTFPEPESWPRSLNDQIALSRHAFMHTLWDEQNQQSHGMLPGPSAHAPDVAVLLTIDSLLTGDTSAAARAKLILARTRAETDLSTLAHSGGHVLRLSIPFFAGHLDDAWPAYHDLAARIMDTMAPDGSWAYYPSPDKKMLGAPGTKTLGVAGWWCVVLWHWARMTGDPRAIRVGREALAHLDTYRIPTGASGWEVPLAAPDILAAVYGVRAFVYAYDVTGDPHYLERARYWARAGLPFIYLWNDPGKPGMRYAALACFGTTFFTHSWLGVPVQWEGLVYADAILELARHDTAYPWRRIAEGLLASALYQQVDARDNTPDLLGTYPDSWGERFTKKIPTFLSPEGIMGVLYQLQNIPLHPHTVIARVEGAPVHVTAGGTVKNVAVNERELSFSVSWLRGGSTCAALPYIARPDAVVIDGAPAVLGGDLDTPGVNARYDERTHTLFLRLQHRGRPVRITLRGIRSLSSELTGCSL